jgi:hypothetical protein
MATITLADGEIVIAADPTVDIPEGVSDVVEVLMADTESGVVTITLPLGHLGVVNVVIRGVTIPIPSAGAMTFINGGLVLEPQIFADMLAHLYPPA